MAEDGGKEMPIDEESWEPNGEREVLRVPGSPFPSAVMVIDGLYLSFHPTDVSRKYECEKKSH